MSDLNFPSEATPGAQLPGDRRERSSLGGILVACGALQADDVAAVVAEQDKSQLRFGEAALKLGLLKQEDILRALSSQYDYSYLSAGDEQLSPSLVAAFDPFCRTVEDLRCLRSQLLIRGFAAREKSRVLTVVSPERGDGRSFIAANLAVLFAHLGERTLLVDADLRNPSVAELFRIPEPVGLSTVLAGWDRQEQAIRPVPAVPGLFALPSGGHPPNPQELISQRALTTLFEALRLSFDVILVDTPAADMCADASLLSRKVGSALLVGKINKTRHRGMKRLVDELTRYQIPVIGSVLNQVR